jgi:hypothetical protein
MFASFRTPKDPVCDRTASGCRPNRTEVRLGVAARSSRFEVADLAMTRWNLHSGPLRARVARTCHRRNRRYTLSHGSFWCLPSCQRSKHSRSDSPNRPLQFEAGKPTKVRRPVAF